MSTSPHGTRSDGANLSPTGGPNPESSPSDRISSLLRSISTVLYTYSAQPDASPLHITTLAQFHQRAASLSTSPPPDPQKDTEFQFGNTSPAPLSKEANRPSPHSAAARSAPVIPSSSFLNLIPGGAMDETLGPPHSRARFSPSHRPEKPTSLSEPTHMSTRNDGPPDHSPSLQEVEELEREWWNSEVVAAFYGPRPEITALTSSRARNRIRVAAGRAHTPILRAKAKPDSRRVNFMDPILRRDAGYIGLHDE